MSNHSAICRHQLRLSRLRELVCRARLREVIYVALFLLAFIIPAPTATSCPFPCNPATQCVPLDSSSCQYGVVKDVCECCDVCGHGPEDLCGPYGKCGTGLICVQGYEEGLSEDDLRDYPSFCEPAPTPTAPASTTTERLATSTTATEATQSPTSTQASALTTTASSSVASPSNCSNSTAPEPASGMPDTTNCREPCSVSFCSDRARICSAAGLEFRKVPRRNGCQHTSCKACFLLVRPNCDQYKCIEPPNKRCLRQYYECIRNHYFSPPQNGSYPVMMRLDDTRAPSWDGEIICHIPEVEDDVWSAG